MRAANQPLAISVEGIEKTYSNVGKAPPARALKGVDLRVDRRSIFCILGPNGAGKTTLVSILSGLLYPDAGKGAVWGLDILREQRKIRSIVNFASGHANLPDNFTIDEMLNYFGMLYGLKKTVRIKKIEDLTRFFEIQEYRKVPFNQLSTGLKQRLVLAKSLLNAPKILFLDEPTVGLDPHVCLLIRSRLKEWQKDTGTTVILTTHQMDEAEQLSDRIAFLKNGRFIRMGDAEELKNSVRAHERVTIRGENLQKVKEHLSMIDAIHQIQLDRGAIRLQIDNKKKALDLVLRTVLDHGATIEHIEISEATLGDVFVELASRPDKN
jgi:ABC-2 type transport system ATP-binding protein